jgi:LPS sulfotransferase NodH
MTLRVLIAESATTGSRLLAAVVAAGFIGGCAIKPIEPWVKPYEREHLADPIMKFSRDSLPEKHVEHVRDVREGARGATGVQGGGCGCN